MRIIRCPPTFPPHTVILRPSQHVCFWTWSHVLLETGVNPPGPTSERSRVLWPVPHHFSRPHTPSSGVTHMKEHNCDPVSVSGLHLLTWPHTEAHILRTPRTDAPGCDGALPRLAPHTPREIWRFTGEGDVSAGAWGAEAPPLPTVPPPSSYRKQNTAFPTTAFKIKPAVSFKCTREILL